MARPAACYFNSRPSARGDSAAQAGAMYAKHFNSRPSARGDNRYQVGDIIQMISIHAPPRGATATWRSRWTHGRRFQFTPLREGRLHGCHCGGYGDAISIHAPPRGATARQRRTWCRAIYFNSRPSARGDQGADGASEKFQKFQFTPLREGRRSKPRHKLRCVLFQFTPLREGRRFLTARAALPLDFNSRPSARGDTDNASGSVVRTISIHAPPRGATVEAYSHAEALLFQFTPLREGRRRPSLRC